PSGDLCVWDIQTVRVTRFDSTGTVAGTAPVDIDRMSRFRPGFVGFLADCSFVLSDRVLARAARRQRAGIVQDTLHYFPYEPHGQPVRRLRVVPEVPRYWRRATDGGWAFDVIFAPRLFAVLRADELWLGVSDSLRWRRFDIDGSSMETFE